jgi:outer membrane protein assembly factor BamB
MLRKASILTTLGALTLAGCAEREIILPGERLGVHEVLQTRAGEAVAQKNFAPDAPISLPGTVRNTEWTQSHVSPHTRVSHAALGTQLQELWSVNIGTGDSRRKRLNADPVVAGGRIFTLDADHVVRATSTAGEPLWSHSLTPERDSEAQAQGGGLAVAGQRLYVASGFGMLSALDAETGSEIWSQKLGNTATGAPTYRDGVVYVVSGDRAGWAIEADTGRVRWQLDGSGDSHNVAGAAAPAVSEKYVTFSYGESTVQTAFRMGGLTLWNAELLGRRNGVTLSKVDDITGDPVVVGDTVYAANHSGRIAALSLANGDRLWTAKQGAQGPVWAAAGSVFFVSDRNQLIRMDAATGEEIWVQDLPGYAPKRNPNRKRDSSFANHGPILAGGRLIVSGSDGLLRSFDPRTGALVSSVEVKGGATTRPVVAGQTLYVVSRKGQLVAYR